jgi:hypothetical protein
MRELFAVFYLSIDMIIFDMQVGKLVVEKHFTMIASCSCAYISWSAYCWMHC